MLEVLASVSHFAVSTPALVSVVLGCSVFLASVGAVTCLCYGRRQSPSQVKLRRDRPMTFQRKPVKSPLPTTHYLRKSPSPTTPGSGGSSPGAAPLLHSAKSSPGVSPSSELQVEAAKPDTHLTTRYHEENEVQRDACCSSPQALVCTKDDVAKDDTWSDQQTGSPPPSPSGKLGQIIFKLRYKKDKKVLVVTVSKCRDLPAKDPNLGSSDPYVKLQILPEKQHKVKTRVLRKTRNPIYDEDFTFYGISTNQLQNLTLHFVVLSFDRYSRDEIIGEVFCSLATIEIPQDNQQISISRDIQPRSIKMKSGGRGELLVSLCWQPAASRLTVVVLKARNLPKMDVTGLADPYVKMYLMYNGQRIAKKKTHVKKRTLNPVFNESFVFEIPSASDALDKINLEFMLLDWDRVTKNEVIGRLEVGGACQGTSLHHWNEVVNSPRRQIAEWHKLKE